MARAHFNRFAVGAFVLVILIGAAALLLSPAAPTNTAPTPPPATETPGPTVVIDFKKNWSEIPGKLSRTYRSHRGGAGLLQLSPHPALEGEVDGVRIEKELDAMLNEMVTEMEFGRRLSIEHTQTPAGPLAFATYQSPSHGMLGFWLLSADPMIFATYVDGGPTTAEEDIREAQEAIQKARLE